ncbi:MAG: 5'-nucleotidase C-terminal domain-containing protein, partial [Rhodothermales bacterium]|nr:5'-nucleotidase C-terminal domain-containing protein [Rhodothermales bacterium]
NLPFISSPRNVVVNSDVLGAVQAEIDALEGMGINKIIVISHLQGIDEDLELISQLTGIDVAIAGGGDELLANPGDLLIPGDEGEEFGPYPVIATDADGNDVPVVTTSGQLAYVGRLKVTFDGDGVVSAIDPSSGPVRVSGVDPDAVEGDADVQANIVDPVSAFVASLATNIIGTSEVELDGVRNNVRSMETNEGNLIADALLWQATELAGDFGVDPPHVSLQNGGGIRNDNVLPPGDISELTTFDILPFGNFLTIVPNISPDHFKEIVENAVSRIGSGSGTGRFAQIAGFRFTYNPDGVPLELDDDFNVVTPGSRVLDIRLDDGTPIVQGGAVVPGAPSVNIATGDFLARGGDQYPYRGAPFTSLGVTDQQTLRNFIVDGLGGVVTAADYPVGGEGRIQVRSLQGTLDALFAAVQALIDSGDLNRGQGNALTKKLEGIARKIEEGETATAINRIGAFINQVEAFDQTDILSDADAAELLELANTLIALLNASDNAEEQAGGEGLEAAQQIALANESTDLEVGLLQNYPNPFAETTEIQFSINRPSRVDLKLYDMLGRVVLQMAEGDRPAGSYRVAMDASDLPSGTYVYQLKVGGHVQSRLMSIVR